MYFYCLEKLFTLFLKNFSLFCEKTELQSKTNVTL